MSENQRNESNPPEVGVAVDVVNDTDAKSSESSEAIAVESKPLPTVNQCDENQTDRSEILSRRKQKKLLKLAKWEETKKLKRQKEREKQKQRRAKEVALGIPGPSSKRKKLKLNKIEDSRNLVSVAIDFDYDDLMHDKDIAKCAKQMLWVYTENRKSEMPIRLHFTSIKENSRIEKALDRNDGYKNWDVKIQREPYYDLFDRNSIVYLSADSDNVLTELEPNAVYIIGGLVDHNHHKGLSFQRAQEQGLRTARLPLSEHIEMKTRVALTIVHVFQILLKISEGKPWKETLLEILPQRKFRIGGKRKHKSKESGNQKASEDEGITEEKIICAEKSDENPVS